MKIFEPIAWSGEIREYESEKQTEKSVFINGNRYSWVSTYSRFFKTYEEAKQWLIDFYESEYQNHSKKAMDFSQKLQNARKL